MKEVKIFIASSIVELEEERRSLQAFETELNRLYRKKGIDLEFVMCESLSQAISKTRKQDEYNEEIRHSDYFTVIIGERIGQYTEEEFKVALDEFRKSNHPSIFTYFKDVGKRDQSVQKFIDMLNKEINHYETHFMHIDTVKLNILLELQRDPKLDLKLNLSNGEISSSFGDIGSINMANVPFYANYKPISELKARKEVLEKEFKIARVKYDEEKTDSAFSLMLGCSKKFEDCKKELIETEKSLFEFARKIINLCSDGDMTGRQKRAKEFADNGDLDKAIEILDDEERMNDFKKTGATIDAGKEALKALVKEALFKIEALRVGGETDYNIEQILEIYGNQVDYYSVNYGLDRGYVVDYLILLKKYDLFEKALEIAEREPPNFSIIDDTETRIRFMCCIGSIYSTLGRYDEGEKQFKEAEAIIKNSSQKPVTYFIYLTGIYLELGWLYICSEQYDESKKYYEQAEFAEYTVRELTKTLKGTSLTDFAKCSLGLGEISYTKCDFDNAKDAFEQALSTYRQLPKTEERSKKILEIKEALDKIHRISQIKSRLK